MRRAKKTLLQTVAHSNQWLMSEWISHEVNQLSYFMAVFLVQACKTVVLTMMMFVAAVDLYTPCASPSLWESILDFLLFIDC
jgi:ABC-type transport system involved in cytochrome bd biosynthesis fused ATPase/permease subunit